MIKASQIDISDVTAEQIGMVFKYFVGSIAFYKAQSESDPFKQYTISWSKEHGFCCTCKSGQTGFSNCGKHLVCKHVRWSLAAAAEEREAIAELEAAICAPQAPVEAVATTYTSVDAETLARVEAACKAPAKVSNAKPYQSKAFSILR